MKYLACLFFSLFVFVSIGQQTRIINMVAEMNKTMVLDDGSTTQYWGYSLIRDNGAYNASIPGPVVEMNKNDTVIINFYNDSPEDHTIHLHGLDVDQANDGVPTTSFTVHSQDTAIYTFVAKHEGAYMYHCHVLTTLHLTMGMYGMLKVYNYPDSTKLFDGGPSFTNEYDFITSDMDLSWNNNTLSIPPMYLFKSNYFMVNGKSGNQLYNSSPNQVHSFVGDSTLLRLGNIAYSKVRYIFPPDVNAIAYMSDGRVLTQSFECDTLVINAGERYSVLLTPTANSNDDIIVEYYEARNNNLEHINYIRLNPDLGAEPVVYENDFTIYPNPVTSTFNFKTIETGGDLVVYDLSGKVVKQQKVIHYSTTVDLSSAKSGFYFVKYRGKSIKVVKR